LPGWFPYNSLHVMQPMYTKEANKKIATEIGTIKQYTEADPARPRPVVVLKQRSSCEKVLKDQKCFVVPWTPAVNSLFPGEKTFEWFMLGGDGPESLANRKLVAGVMHKIPNLKETVANFVSTVGASLLKKESFAMTKELHQLDIIREYVT
jgi:cytochrome P450